MSIELCVFGLFSFTFRTVKLFCWIHNKYDYLKLITNTIFDHYHNLNRLWAQDEKCPLVNRMLVTETIL